MDNPKISVIIPVYNVEPYLRRCLDSVIRQTYTNLEIILVDDGSTDGSSAVCDEYKEKDSRILVIHKENGGVSSARNAGLEMATGEWIGFVDSDDWVETDMYEYLYELAKEHETDVAQCAVAMENGSQRETLFSAVNVPSKGITRENLKILSNSVCNKLYRSAPVNGLSFECTYPIGEDALFNVAVLARSSSFVFSPAAKYHYNYWTGSASHTRPSVTMLQSIRQTSILAMERLRNMPEVVEHFTEEFFRNELDICSKIVRFPDPSFHTIECEIRLHLRENTKKYIAMRGLTVKDRTKLFLVAWAWWLYRILLIASKKF